ncbi:MAG: polyprenyl synthetase family protein [Acidobacteria bacterium]|nr:polyprenyl synthetase family protein [Acidobacteriota bacterium]
MTSTETFAEFVELRRCEIERALDAWLPVPPACPDVIADAIRYAVGSRGKRLRPLLALASAEAVASASPCLGLSAEAARRLAMPAACAAELIHTQSLVHDDLPAMDDDAMRRGQPAVHVRYGEGLAILAGDALLVEAFALLASVSDGGCDREMMSRRLRAVSVFTEAVGVRGMAGGQAIDLALTGTAAATTAPSLFDVWELHRRKTGCLFRAAAAGGAILAGGSDRQVEALTMFAERVGIAFQIADDILDIEGSTSALGKTAGKDARAGKPTFAVVAGVGRARAMAIDTVADAIATLDIAGLATAPLRGLAWGAVQHLGASDGDIAVHARPRVAMDLQRSADHA